MKLKDIMAAMLTGILYLAIIGLALLVTGWIWLGVISVWQMIF